MAFGSQVGLCSPAWQMLQARGVDLGQPALCCGLRFCRDCESWTCFGQSFGIHAWRSQLFLGQWRWDHPVLRGTRRSMTGTTSNLSAMVLVWNTQSKTYYCRHLFVPCRMCRARTGQHWLSHSKMSRRNCLWKCWCFFSNLCNRPNLNRILEGTYIGLHITAVFNWCGRLKEQSWCSQIVCKEKWTIIRHSCICFWLFNAFNIRLKSFVKKLSHFACLNLNYKLLTVCNRGLS